MENSRLSKIEEELEKLDIHQFEQEPYRSQSWSRSPTIYEAERHFVIEQSMKDPGQAIYSKAVIKPKSQLSGELEGMRKITEKYDSLGKVKPLREVESRSEENLAVCAYPGITTYSTGSLGRRRDISTLAAAPPRDEYIHIAPEVVAQYPVPSAPMSNLNAHDRKLVDADILQVEMFFRSHKTDVFVCTCMVHMYFSSVIDSPTMKCKVSDDWQYVKSGLLVLLMDNGEARSRARRITIILAEKGTGFQIWKDQINKFTDYKAPSMGFHTMHLSADHTRRVGFGFDDTVCASDFHRKLMSTTKDPANEDIIGVSCSSKNRKKRKDEKKFKKYRAPNKSDISSPCCFTHITKLDRTDGISIVNQAAPSKPQQRDFRNRRLSPVKMTRVANLLHHDT